MSKTVFYGIIRIIGVGNIGVGGFSATKEITYDKIIVI